MTAYTSDTFNRANSTNNLGSTSGPGSLGSLPWTQRIGATWGINANQAYTSTQVPFAIATVSVAQSDLTLTVTIAALDISTNGGGLAFRYSNTTNWLAVRASGTALQLIQDNAGAQSVLATAAAPVAAGDVITVALLGPSIKVYRNAALVITFSTAFNQTAVLHGLYLNNGTTTRLDNFSIQPANPVSNLSLIDGTAGFQIVQTPNGQLASVSTPVVTGVGKQTLWQVVAVNSDPANQNASPLHLAQPKQIRWPKKNVPVEVDIEMPLDDPTFAQINPATAGNREVQVYRNGVMLGQFKPWTRRVDSKNRVWTITCKDPLEYFRHRYVGKANRTNYLVNGGFESGTTGWTADAGVSFTTPTGDALVDTHYANVASFTGGAIRQSVTMRSGGLGLAVFLTVWRKVQQFTSPAGFNLGVLLQRRGASGPGSADYVIFVGQTPQGVYERVSLNVEMPPNVTEIIDVSFWVGAGTNRFDAATLTVEESLYYGGNTVATINEPVYDQAAIMSSVILYAQGRGNFGYLSTEKSDLFVNPSMAATGIKKPRVYQLADHQRIYDGGDGMGVLDEFLRSDDGLDVRMEYTPTTKTLKSYYPAYAPVRLDLPLVWHNYPDAPELCAALGIEGWSYGDSLEQSANQIAMLGGWDSGADDAFASREEGGFSDPSTLGGLTLEKVDTAPDKAPIGSLNRLAAGLGAQLKDPIVTPTFTLAEPKDPVTGATLFSYIGVIVPGVIVPLDVIDGTVVMQGQTSIASVTLDCETEKMTVTVDA